MTRTELVEAVRRIVNADGAEHEIEALLEKVECHVPDPNVSDLIFYPPGGVELTPEEVVDIALAYEPLPLAAARSEAGRRDSAG
jgi:hypothetical protein